MPLFAHWRHSSAIASDVRRGGPHHGSEMGDVSIADHHHHHHHQESSLTCASSAPCPAPSASSIAAAPAPPQPSPAPPSPPPIQPSSCFCFYDEQIETDLQTLHKRQRVHGDVQHRIDIYLVACISPDLRHLVLPHHNVPHYDNLPDISSYALGILDPSMDSEPELQQVLLLLRQCTPLRRRTKRAQREVQWKEDSLFPMQTLVRCMQGTLLGLYPNCLKAIPFGARVALLRFLRTLLVLPFAKLHACMQRFPYIIKLAVMEHLCNTIYDYHPGICHTLNRSGQKVEHFCNSVSTICDIFRGELNTFYCSISSSSSPLAEDAFDRHHDTAIVLHILPRLEKIAHSYFERCTRAYRGIIVGNIQPPRSIDHARRLCQQLYGMTMTASAFSSANTPAHARSLRARTPEACDETEPRELDAAGAADRSTASIPSLHTILTHIRIACNQNVFDLMHRRLFSLPAVRDLAWHLTQTVRVHPLPACIALRQHEALLRRYSGDTTCVQRCRVLHLCIQCVIRRGSVQGTRLRHDCLTGELVCMHCGEGTVLRIDMLGRIVSVASDNLILSVCCGAFIYYAGNGCEFCRECGPQCSPKQQLYRKRERSCLPSSQPPLAPSSLRHAPPRPSSSRAAAADADEARPRVAIAPSKRNRIVVSDDEDDDEDAHGLANADEDTAITTDNNNNGSGCRRHCAKLVARKRYRLSLSSMHGRGGNDHNNNDHAGDPPPRAIANAATTAALKKSAIRGSPASTVAQSFVFPTSCFICKQKHGIQQTIHLLDVPKRTVLPHALCSKHTVPYHIARHVHDKHALLRFFRQKDGGGGGDGDDGAAAGRAAECTMPLSYALKKRGRIPKNGAS